MANTLMSLLVSIGVDTADFQKGITGAEKSALSFAGKMQKIGGQMQKVGGAMTLGLTLPIAAFGASSVQSAMDAESALADLEAVLKSTGSAAGMTLDELTNMATALQKTTKFSDETIMSAQGMLLTFTNIGKEVFPDATMAALDMAEKFGMDASQAAITLGKALNDPIAGVTALRRIGVMLTEEQEAQIKSFMAVGDIASAQALIMNELAVEIGGVAEAAGATSQGEFEQFKNQLDDMKEIIGSALIPVLSRLMEAVTPLIEKFANASPAMQNTIIAIAGIVAVAGPLISVVGGITSAVGTLTPILSGLFTFITATAIPAIAAFVVANAAWIVPLLLVAGTIYLVYLAFKNNFGGITTTVQQLGFIIQYFATNIVNAFIGVWDALTKTGYQFTLLFEDGSGALLDLATAFGIPKQAAQEFLVIVFDSFNKVMNTAKQLHSIFLAVAVGVVMAISRMIQKVFELIAALAKLKLPDDLTPGSPTPFEMGLRGINSAMGILANKQLPNLQTGLDLVPNVTGMSGQQANSEGVGGGLNITINNPKGEPSEESVRKTLQKLSYLGVTA